MATSTPLAWPETDPPADEARATPSPYLNEATKTQRNDRKQEAQAAVRGLHPIHKASAASAE
jgi:hypothetical protein